jgi:hypothetical protein
VFPKPDLFLSEKNINNYKFMITKNFKRHEISGYLLQILNNDEFHNLSH